MHFSVFGLHFCFFISLEGMFMFTESLWRQWRIIGMLLWREFSIIRKDFWGNLLDMMIWPSITALVFGYVLPAVGQMPESFGPFVLVGSVLTVCVVVSFNQASQIVGDFEHVGLIEYQRTLPLSTVMLFVKMVLSTAMHCTIMAFPIFFIGTALLWHRWSWENLSVFKFFIAYPLIALLLGTVCFFIASKVARTSEFIHIWMRVFSTFLWLGCFMFSWAQINSVAPVASYALLFNPMTYCMESIRVATLGQAGLLPFWYCAIALLIGTIFFFIIGRRSMKRRLDAV